MEKKEKFRIIESKDRRIVHFLFKPNVKSKISAFARKYKRFLDGSLEEFDNEEKKNFEAYIARLKADELEDDPDSNGKETNPVKYEDMPFDCF